MPRIIRFYEPGPAEVQRIDDMAVAACAADDVRIRVQAIGLNQSDLIYRRGQHPLQPPLPSCNGAEAAGIVAGVGANVSAFAAGDAVVVVPHMNPARGTYAELIDVDAALVMPASARLSTRENAAFWASYLTAYGGLIATARLAAGDFVIIPAASSSVGLAAIQIANAVGAIPVALTRNESKLERLRAAGARHAFVSGSEDLAAQLRECSGGLGARVVFDPVGGSGATLLAEAMARRGIYVLYGAMSGDATPFPVAAAFEKLLTMTIFRLDYVNRPEELPAARAFLDDALGKGLLKPSIDSEFAFDDVIAAHRYMERGEQFGKIILATAAAGLQSGG